MAVVNMNGKSRDSRDSSDMFFSRRSRFTLAILQYNAVVFLLVAGPAFCYFYYYTRPAHVIDNSIVFDLACAVALLVLLPGDGLVWLNVLFNLLPPRPDRYRNQPKVRNFSRLLICLASKGDNVDAVERTVRSMHGWQQVHKKISFHIVTEEPKAQAFYQRFAKDDDVEVVAVPVGFSAKKAKYKARALEYARSHFQLTSSDWVLHLDEETFVDAYALKACIDVIERTRFDFAQGYIFYNHHGYWNNWLLTLGDLVRVTDDIGRYQWQANFLGSPVLGVHGSFFMINGEVENVTTWDTDNLTEDYWFATRAQKLGFKYGWIPAIAREQSPSAVKDYVLQRRRWWRGIRTLGLPVASALCLSWTWRIIGQQISLMFNVLHGPSFKMPLWLWGIYSFNSAVNIYNVVLALVVQDLDARVHWTTILIHLLAAMMLVPWTYALEGASLLSAVFDVTTGFDVISK